MKFRSLSGCIGALCALLLFASLRAAGQTPTIEQSLSMPMVGSPRLSPDGRYVVYQQRSADWEQNTYITQLWIAVCATGERYPLTSGKKSCSSPAWSPDSRRVTFLSSREGTPQLYLIAPTGGEACKLTNVETGINDYHWSPNGKQIALTTEDAESQELKDEKEKSGDLKVFPPRFTMTHLWLLDVPTDIPDKPVVARRLTEGQKFTVGDFSWSPDSQRLAFSASQDPEFSSLDTQRIYVLNVADRSVQKLMDTKGPNDRPTWSPDGKEIAYVTANGQENYLYTNPCIAVVSAQGGVPTVFTDVFDEDPNLLAWTPDGIYFSAAQKTYAHLFRLNPQAKRVERISMPTEIIGGDFSFNHAGTQVAFTLADAKSASDIAISPISGFAPRRLTNMTEQFLKFKIATREVISWRASDGTPIEGILYKPHDFEKGRKYPLFCILHGGPTDVDRASIGSSAAFPIEQLVAKGALILRVNYRGSAGYGAKFRALNV
ncbi:MAG: peptidase prolyl oligopeptidase active site domain protein, partial [Chthonomonadaceae bacterium]|nr:peptidase prolyl oligopeptidase active site domain protein [Chthonomonadaceae bacterium]